MREYSELQLYTQMCFYEYIFDFQKACQDNKDDRIRDDNLRKIYGMLKAEVMRFSSMNSYCRVDLGELFKNVYPNKKLIASQTKIEESVDGGQ